ncbi:MAG: hypothetical protein ACOYM0_15000 [Bacteroidales bacterium]
MKIRINNRKPRIQRPKEGPLSRRSLLELSLFSTFTFIFSALLMQFLLTVIGMLLLKYFGLKFQYSLFHITFLSHSNTRWSAGMIYLVFGSGPLLLSAAGVILLLVLKNLKMAGWKTKLILTWLAFLFLNALPCGILAGTLFFDGFGMAFFWAVNSFIIRGILALVVLAALVLLSRFWYRLFLKSAYTTTFLDSSETQKTFIVSVFLKPWIAGVIILMGFNFPFKEWYWPVFLLSLGYMAVTLIGSQALNRKPRIKKSDKQIFTSRTQMVFVAIALVLIWVAGNVKITF